MPKQALESLTESMFYLLMALTQGERCGTEITAFAAEITAGRVKIGPAFLRKSSREFFTVELSIDNSIFLVAMRFWETPVLIPNTMVKT